jgi:hypothetical protein
MRRLTTALTMAASGILALAGCSSDSSTGVNASNPTTLDGALAQFSMPSLFSAAASLSGISAPAALDIVPSGCTYAAASQNFVCVTVNVGGMAVSTTVTLYDASGAPQSAYNAATTAAMHVTTSATGTLPATSVTGPLALNEHQDLTLSGLLTPTHVMNGTTAVQLSGSMVMAGASTSVSENSTITMTNLALPATAGGFPSSGSMTVDELSAIGGTSVHTNIALTFNGTSKVGMVTTVSGHVQNCVIDLTSPGAFTCS